MNKNSDPNQPIDSAAALSAITANAKSLLEDAELMFQNDRYARAMALAILCIEEVGKYFITKWRSGDWHSTARLHERKQKVVATFDQAQAACDVMRAIAEEMLRELATKYKLEPSPEEWLNGPNGREFWDFVWGSERMLQSVSEAIKEASGSPIVSAALAGALSGTRNSGFYVDLDSNGNLRSDPNSIGADMASEYLSYAKSAVARMQDNDEAVDKAGEAMFKTTIA